MIQHVSLYRDPTDYSLAKIMKDERYFVRFRKNKGPNLRTDRPDGKHIWAVKLSNGELWFLWYAPKSIRKAHPGVDPATPEGTVKIEQYIQGAIDLLTYWANRSIWGYVVRERETDADPWTLIDYRWGIFGPRHLAIELINDHYPGLPWSEGIVTKNDDGFTTSLPTTEEKPE
jgi:hypothetical protein